MCDRMARSCGGRASSVGPRGGCGWESGMRSLEVEEWKEGTGGRGGGVVNRDGDRFSLLLLGTEVSCVGCEEFRTVGWVSKDCARSG